MNIFRILLRLLIKSFFFVQLCAIVILLSIKNVMPKKHRINMYNLFYLVFYISKKKTIENDAWIDVIFCFVAQCSRLTCWTNMYYILFELIFHKEYIFMLPHDVILPVKKWTREHIHKYTNNYFNKSCLNWSWTLFVLLVAYKTHRS